MAGLSPGKVNTSTSSLINPLDPTWQQSIRNLNHRPHPAFALDTSDDDDDDDDDNSDCEDGTGRAGSDASEMSARPRWESWTKKERDINHPGYIRRAQVMNQDCELLRREEEGENGDLSDPESENLPVAQLPSPIATTTSIEPFIPTQPQDETLVPTSPVAPSPSLAAPAAHDFALDPPPHDTPHSPLPPTPSLIVPPAPSPSTSSPPAHFPPPVPALPLSRLPVPPRPLARPSSPPAAPDSFDDPAPLPPRKTYGKKRAQSEAMLVADSSDDEPDTAESMRARLQGMGRKPSLVASVKPKASLKRSKTTPAAPAKAPAAKKGRNKARQSTDGFLDAIKTATAFNKHKQQHATISSTIDQLAGMPVVPVGKPLFTDVHVVLVNHYSTLTSRRPNAVDIAHMQQMKLLLRNGATLIKPEEFRSAAYRASEGLFATHVIPLEVAESIKTNPTFDQVLDLLGPRQIKIRPDQLGSEVKVVGWKWVADSLDCGHRLNEARYAWPGDPRSPLGSPSKRATVAGPVQELRRADDDTDEMSTDQEDQPGTDGTDNDNAPAQAYLTVNTAVAAPLRGGFPSSLSSPPPIPSPRRRRIQPSAIEGLEKELKMVEQFGFETVDLMVADGDASDTARSDLYVFSTLDDDDQTDEEGSDEDQDRIKSKHKPLYMHGPEGKYTCDQPNTGKVGDKYSVNEPAAQVFDSMSELVRQDKMRQRAYRLAAGALRNRVDLVDTYEKAKAIRGIGHKLALKVVEIQKTGTLRRLANTTSQERVTAIFREIYGVGSVIANALFDLGCRTIDDVRNLTDQQFKLTPAQRLGLQYYDDLTTKMPRVEVKQFHDLAREAAAAIDPKLLVFAMGSYIRGAEECGDVDFIVTRDTSDGKDHGGMIRRLWEKLGEKGMIRHSLADPSDWEGLSVKYNGLCAVPGQEGARMRRIDILGVPWDELPAARIYFTGNDFFNRSMRLKAAHLGLRLNQRGLYQDVMRGPGKVKVTEGVKVPGIKSEEDIFRALKVPWREPWERLP